MWLWGSACQGKCSLHAPHLPADLLVWLDELVLAGAEDIPGAGVPRSEELNAVQEGTTAVRPQAGLEWRENPSTKDSAGPVATVSSTTPWGPGGSGQVGWGEGYAGPRQPQPGG